MKNIDLLNGYEFEDLICELLRKMRFSVEHTMLSGDGGIDIIAYSNDIMLKGKYLVQCKCFSGMVGEPYIRDLFGVVLSQNANKGILITNSFFTKKAIEFAEGKNIELINGDQLNDLLHKYELSYKEDISIEKTHFSKCEKFDLNKYEYLKKLVDTNRKSFNAYNALFEFLYQNIIDKKEDILYLGLIDECLFLAEEIVKRFGKSKNYSYEISTYKQISICLLIIKGDINKAYEKICLENLNKLSILHFGGRVFSPISYRFIFENFQETCQETKTTLDYSVLLRNVLVIFVKLNFIQGVSSLKSEFNNSFEKHLNQSCGLDNELILKNREMYEAQLLEVLSGIDKRIYLPQIQKYARYSADFFYDFDNIFNNWEKDNNLEEQLKNIEFLLNM